MRVSLTEPYKSLSPFPELELPDFIVLTGKNGSGKTHFVELLDASNKSFPRKSLTVDIPFEAVLVGTLNTNLPSSVAPQNWNSIVSQHWSDYVTLVHYMHLLELLYLANPELNLVKITREDLAMFILEHGGKKAIQQQRKVGVEFSPDTPDFDVVNDLAATLTQRGAAIEAIRYVALKAGKPMNELGQNDFYQFPPREQFLGRQHLFYSGLDNIFFNYAKRRSLNFIHLVSNQKLGTSYNCLEDDDFVKLEKSPWDTINQIFEEHGIDYFFEGITPEKIFADVPLELRLFKKSTGQVVFGNNLSNGEKVIMSLIIALFISVFYEDNISKPELYVVDEPDAFLHPELSKLLLDVLQNTFVRDLKIKVLITTHSPSTVAIAPEESLYRIQNGPNTTITKISKDDSLKDLTYGVPNLSIDYKNHRQVFVEGPSDNLYYRNLYSVDSIYYKYYFKPYFINAGSGSNLHSVQQFVSQLREAGNDKVYGIIDWDLKNKPIDSIEFHGENEFYSLENCLFNPIYIVAYHLMQEKSEGSYKHFKVSSHVSYSDLGRFLSSEELQKLSDAVIKDLVSKNPTVQGGGKDLFKFSFLNDKTISLPQWFLNKKGDDLGKLIRDSFPILKSKLSNEKAMEEIFTGILIRSYPFVPKTSIDLLRNLCN
jgi:Cdc6-like AAA superfamily ATPase